MFITKIISNINLIIILRHETHDTHFLFTLNFIEGHPDTRHATVSLDRAIQLFPVQNNLLTFTDRYKRAPIRSHFCIQTSISVTIKVLLFKFNFNINTLNNDFKHKNDNSQVYQFTVTIIYSTNFNFFHILF